MRPECSLWVGRSRRTTFRFDRRGARLGVSLRKEGTIVKGEPGTVPPKESAIVFADAAVFA